MSRNRIELPARPEQVFDVLIDPYNFPKWVTGAKRIRGVDADWPRPGAAFYHASGAGGDVTIKDKTELVSANRPQSLVLQAYLRPLGIVRIRLYLDHGSSPETTCLTIEEAPAPGSRLKPFATLLSPPMRLRNHKSLQCLHKLVVDKAGNPESPAKPG